jgi:hypothetical protein
LCFSLRAVFLRDAQENCIQNDRKYLAAAGKSITMLFVMMQIRKLRQTKTRQPAGWRVFCLAKRLTLPSPPE